MTTSRTPRRVAARVLVGVTLLASLTACTSGQSEEGEGSASGPNLDDGIQIAYIQKQGDQQYFVDQAAGAQEVADELGADLNVIDVGDDANQAISAVETEIARGVDAIIIVVPDQQIGPTVAQLAADAGIPLLASDDGIETGDGEAVPFVGFDGTAMGEVVGADAAERFEASGWDPATTRILSVFKPDLSVCVDRVEGAASAFAEGSGADVEQIDVGTDNTSTGAQDETGAIITGNPDVEHWIVWGCNDENVSGAVTALENSGVATDAIIGVGLGAYLACKPWAAGQATGLVSALYISGAEVGASAVQAVYTAVEDGSDLPPETFANTAIVDAETYEAEGLVCT